MQTFNQKEEFNKGIQMPPPIPEIPIEPVIEPEHPNASVLEHIFEDNHEQMVDNNSVLQHIFENQNEQLTDVNAVLGHSFELQTETIDELKSIKESLDKLNEPWDIKLTLE